MGESDSGKFLALHSRKGRAADCARMATGDAVGQSKSSGIPPWSTFCRITLRIAPRDTPPEACLLRRQGIVLSQTQTVFWRGLGQWQEDIKNAEIHYQTGLCLWGAIPPIGDAPRGVVKFEKWEGGASIPLHDRPCTGSVPATSRIPPYSDVTCLRAGGPSLSFRIVSHENIQIVAVLRARLEIETRDATHWANEAMDSQRGDWRRAFWGVDQFGTRERLRQPRQSIFRTRQSVQRVPLLPSP
jgi:hypothetical protein